MHINKNQQLKNNLTVTECHFTAFSSINRGQNVFHLIKCAYITYVFPFNTGYKNAICTLVLKF